MLSLPSFDCKTIADFDVDFLLVRLLVDVPENAAAHTIKAHIS